MIEFEGSNYSFEVFSYVFDDPFRAVNMGRIHFNHSPLDIAYIEGSVYETETEFVENSMGFELEPLITAMTIMSIYKIKFKNGEEFISKSIKGARQGLAVPPSDLLKPIGSRLDEVEE